MKGNLIGANSQAEQIEKRFDLTSIDPQHHRLSQNYFTKDELMEQPNYVL